jgi:hypothetical protein
MAQAAKICFEEHKESNDPGRLALRGGGVSVVMQYGDGVRKIVAAIVSVRLLALVHSRDPFFNETPLHADRAICFDLLRNCNIGFVRQVLTFARERSGSLTQMSRRLNASIGGKLYELVKYHAGARKIEFQSERLHFCHKAHEVSVFGLGAATSK